LLTIQKKQAKYFAFRREKATVESGLYAVFFHLYTQRRSHATIVYQFDIRRIYRHRRPLSVINISVIKQTIHQYLKQTYLV
jgi:hypothetical protein